jgi:hypothetical protein
VNEHAISILEGMKKMFPAAAIFEVNFDRYLLPVDLYYTLKNDGTGFCNGTPHHPGVEFDPPYDYFFHVWYVFKRIIEEL